MTPIEYSYTILRYRHDAATGEQLNVGVVLYSQPTGEVGMLHSQRYGRLSEAFAGFDGETYRAVLARLGTALHALARPMAEGLFQLDERERYADAAALVRAAWPDQGLGYFAAPPAYGVTDDFQRELHELFDRFVLSQHDRRDTQARFDDEQLWDEFRRVLTPRGITRVLEPKMLGPAEVEFQHAYKNEKWHVIEPVSLDYVDGAEMKRRAYVAAGKASAVRDVEELGGFTVLLGRPKRVESEKAYLAARRILADAPLRIRLVEEHEAEQFAAELEQDMRRHGVLT